MSKVIVSGTEVHHFTNKESKVLRGETDEPGFLVPPSCYKHSDLESLGKDLEIAFFFLDGFCVSQVGLKSQG